MMNSSRQQVNIAACPVMLGGLKADFHAQRYAIKHGRVPFDAGFDIYPDRSDPKVEDGLAGSIITVGTSLTVTPPIGSFGLLHPRSSATARLSGALVRTGIIDTGYTGEILIIVTCHKAACPEVVEIIRKLAVDETAIAQMIMIPSLMPQMARFDKKIADQLGRGSNGFGSTDVIA